MIHTLLRKWFFARLKLPRDVHRFAFRKFTNRPLIQFEDRAITYGEMQDRAYRLAAAWAAFGIAKGDTVFVQADSTETYFTARFAALEAGVVITLFHAAHSPAFILLAAKAANPKLLILDEASCPDCKTLLATHMPELPIWETGKGGAVQRAMSASQPKPSSNVIAPGDPMTLIFTSGTTGAPKGVISSHRATILSIKMVVANLKGKPDRNARNVTLSAIPMAGAGSGLILPTCLGGGTLVVQDRYTCENLVALIERFKVTRLFLTPSQLIDIIDTPTSEDSRLASLNHVVYGTSAMPAAKLEEAIKRFGPIFQQGYGQAEVLPPVSLLSVADHLDHGEIAPRHILRSCGKVVDGVAVRVVDPQGNAVANGEIGEILVKTPTRFSTYLNLAQNQDVILDDGFFRTGDHGVLDDTGYLSVVNRTADIIHTKHGTIFPRNIEEEAHDVPAVKECSMVEINGAATLCVSLRAQFKTTDTSQIITEISGLLAARFPQWMLPSSIQIFDEIPRSYLGKIIRNKLKEQLEHAS